MNAGGYDHIYYTVKDLINQQKALEDFIKITRQRNLELRDCVNEISYSWHDSQYDEFRRCMSEFTSYIDERLKGVVHTNTLLQEYIAELLRAI